MIPAAEWPPVVKQIAKLPAAVPDVNRGVGGFSPGTGEMPPVIPSAFPFVIPSPDGYGRTA